MNDILSNHWYSDLKGQRCCPPIYFAVIKCTRRCQEFNVKLFLDGNDCRSNYTQPISQMIFHVVSITPSVDDLNRIKRFHIYLIDVTSSLHICSGQILIFAITWSNPFCSPYSASYYGSKQIIVLI